MVTCVRQNAASIQKVTVIGAGVIGASWVAFFLVKGFSVAVVDPAPDALDTLTDSLKAILGTSFTSLSDRLHFCTALVPALAETCFVQENGSERLDLKREIFEALDDILPANVLIASSSSGIKMSDIQIACKKHPERCLIGHPFNPPHLIPLVELVGGTLTSQNAVEEAGRFYKSLGKQTIVLKKEMTGHVANRLAAALYREAYYLIAEDVVSVEDADKAVAWGPGLRWGIMGPSLVYHLGGGQQGMSHFLEQFNDPMQAWWNDLGTPVMTDATNRKLIDGVVAAQGSYTLQQFADERDRLLARLIEERKRSFLP